MRIEAKRTALARGGIGIAVSSLVFFSAGQTTKAIPPPVVGIQATQEKRSVVVRVEVPPGGGTLNVRGFATGPNLEPNPKLVRGKTVALPAETLNARVSLPFTKRAFALLRKRDSLKARVGAQYFLSNGATSSPHYKSVQLVPPL